MVKYKVLSVFILSCFILFTFSKCKNANEEELYSNVCDTTNLSYSRDIKPILETNCYYCHSGAVISGGFNMADFNDLAKHLDNGVLINAINRKTGYPQMPYLRDKLPTCLINKISAWNNMGHPQN